EDGIRDATVTGVQTCALPILRRFSRLFSAHVYAEPDAETTVPKPGLAMTLTQGSGVSRSPSRTTGYSRPPSAKPPVPLAKVRARSEERRVGNEGVWGRGGGGG